MEMTESYVDVSKQLESFKCACGSDSVLKIDFFIEGKRCQDHYDNDLPGHPDCDAEKICHQEHIQTFRVKTGDQLCLLVNAIPGFDLVGFAEAVQKEKVLARSGQQRI